MIDLAQLKKALLSIDGPDAMAAIEQVDRAAGCLREAEAKMQNIYVRGRDAVDKLYGCMLAVDILIGKEQDNG